MTRGDPLKHCNQELASEADAAAPDQPATMVRGPVEAWNGREFQSNLGKHFVNMEKDLMLVYDFNSFTKILHVIYWNFSGFQ